MRELGGVVPTFGRGVAAPAGKEHANAVERLAAR